MDPLDEKLLSLQRLIEQADDLLSRNQYAKSEAKLLAAFDAYDHLDDKPVEPDPPPEDEQNHPGEPSSFEAAETSVRKFLEENLFGQPDAVEAGVHAYLQSRATIKRPDAPLCIIMSLGRSRTGKSELPRLLAQFLHGNRNALIRVDLSQYREDHQIATLIGSPPGYVGYNNPAKFSRQTLEKSREASKNSQIILVLEEFEKAHPVVADVLLGLFDNGELELANGETVNFRDVMIFMTSNLAAKEVSQLGKTFVGFSAAQQAPNDKQIRAEVNRMIAKQYRPEFVNRLDRIVVYRELTEESLRKILQREITWLADQVQQATKSKLEFAECAKGAILKTAISRAELADDDKGAGSAVAEMKRLLTQQLLKKLNATLSTKQPGYGSRLVARCSSDDPEHIEFSLEDVAANQSEELPRDDCSLALFRTTLRLSEKLNRGHQQKRVESLWRRAFDSLDFRVVPADERVTPALRLAQAYIEERNFIAAEKCLTIAEEKFEELSHPSDKLLVARAVADYWESRQKWRLAVPKLRALFDLEKNGRSSDAVDTSLRIATCLLNHRKFTEADSELQRALALSKRGEQRARILCKLSEANRLSGQEGTPSEFVKQAAAQIGTEAVSEAAACLREEEAALMYDANHYEEARQLYERALEMRKQLHGPDSLKVATVQIRLAMCHFSLRDRKSAIHLLESAARTLKRHRCIRTASGATILAKLSGIYKLEGRLVESITLADAVEEIEIEADSGISPDYITLYDAAVAAEYKEKYAEAETKYLRLLDLFSSAQPEVTPETPAIYERLHRIALQRTAAPEAELHLTRAQVLIRELFGCRKNENLIDCAERLGEAFSIQAKETWAESFFRLAIIFAQRYGTPVQEAHICRRYAELLESSERHVEALQLKSRATRLRRKRKKSEARTSVSV